MAYVDPLPEHLRAEHEDPNGIAVRRHPEAWLVEEPELWPLVDRFRAGCSLEPSWDLYEQLSGFELDCLTIMRAALGREHQRALERPTDGGSEE